MERHKGERQNKNSVLATPSLNLPFESQNSTVPKGTVLQYVYYVQYSMSSTSLKHEDRNFTVPDYVQNYAKYLRFFQIVLSNCVVNLCCHNIHSEHFNGAGAGKWFA